MVSPMTRYQAALIEALRILGEGWHTRNDIARALSKTRLHPGELLALDDMATRGSIVERQMEPRREGEAVFHWTYRIKGGEDADQTGKPYPAGLKVG